MPDYQVIIMIEQYLVSGLKFGQPFLSPLPFTFLREPVRNFPRTAKLTPETAIYEKTFSTYKEVKMEVLMSTLCKVMLLLGSSGMILDSQVPWLLNLLTGMLVTRRIACASIMSDNLVPLEQQHQGHCRLKSSERGARLTAGIVSAYQYYSEKSAGYIHDDVEEL